MTLYWEKPIFNTAGLCDTTFLFETSGDVGEKGREALCFGRAAHVWGPWKTRSLSNPKPQTEIKTRGKKGSGKFVLPQPLFQVTGKGENRKKKKRGKGKGGLGL